ncbi:MAG: hypothetical protein K2M16_01980 [Muribaculaceae bacterium]|nr:hypothetical protein [Muribaculaceae bacterium]
MKKITYALAVALSASWVSAGAQDLTVYSDTLVAVSSEASYIPMSEEEIMFAVRLPEKSGLSDEVAGLLENKVVQILGRCGAGASGNRDVFVIEPVVTLDGERKSEGLIRNVTSVNGELSLTARHRYSDAVFFNTVVPLNAAAKGSGSDPFKLLVKAIRPADAAYVRFIKNARKNAFEFGLIHPEIYEIPEAAESKKDDEIPMPQDAALPSDSIPSIAAPSAAPLPVMQPQAGADAEVYVSSPSWKVQFAGCEYDAATRTIRFSLRVTNMEQTLKDGVYTRIEMALDADGGKYRNLGIDDYHHDFPYDVPVMVHGYIKDVYSNPREVPFVQVSLGNQRIELRNMIVREPQQ